MTDSDITIQNQEALQNKGSCKCATKGEQVNAGSFN